MFPILNMEIFKLFFKLFFPSPLVLRTELHISKGEFLVTAHQVTAAAAAAKLLQSCPTLCHPIDGSPPGSSVHGIFQARVLESGAIAFPNQVSEVFLKSLILFLSVLHCPGFLLQWFPVQQSVLQ